MSCQYLSFFWHRGTRAEPEQKYQIEDWTMLPDEFPLTSHVDFQDHATSKCMIKLDSRSLLISWQAREASNPPAFV